LICTKKEKKKEKKKYSCKILDTSPCIQFYPAAANQSKTWHFQREKVFLLRGKVSNDRYKDHRILR
jgi:hypothetical protein